MSARSNAYLCMAGSILLSSVAQLSMKVSMLLVSQQTVQNETLLSQLMHSNILLWLFAGLACYAISMLFWLFAIARLDLSLAYPMLSLSYVIVYLVAVSWPLLNEELSWTRSLGILIVTIGVVLISRTDTSEEITENSHKQIN